MTLQEFFVEVAKLTVNHRVLWDPDGDDTAWVSPSDLSRLLEQVDPNWTKLADAVRFERTDPEEPAR